MSTRRDGRVPEPPLRGESGDQGIGALFFLLLVLAVVVGASLYMGVGLFFLN